MKAQHMHSKLANWQTHKDSVETLSAEQVSSGVLQGFILDTQARKSLFPPSSMK